MTLLTNQSVEPLPFSPRGSHYAVASAEGIEGIDKPFAVALDDQGRPLAWEVLRPDASSLNISIDATNVLMPEEFFSWAAVWIKDSTQRGAELSYLPTPGEPFYAEIPIKRLMPDETGARADNALSFTADRPSGVRLDVLRIRGVVRGLLKPDYYFDDAPDAMAFVGGPYRDCGGGIPT